VSAANPSGNGALGTCDRFTILVVDDDQDLRQLVCRMLDQQGHRTLEASNGIAGLRILETTPVDVILTDVVMPDLEGLEFIRRIRRLSLSSKVIVMSGGGRGSAGDYLALATLFGADATLPKPFSATELGEVVQRIMSPR
jgi:DNA-binding response OmpR family regulator